MTDIILKSKESTAITSNPPILATLKWETRTDLDLYCFYVTQKNEIGKIFYKDMGGADKYPHVYLNQDSKKGGSETMTILRPELLKYALIVGHREFESGAGSFESAKAEAVIENETGNSVSVPLHEGNDYAYWVAIARLDFTETGKVTISHAETYSKADVEQAPVIKTDGTFKMDGGKVEFKEDKKCFVATGVYGSCETPEVRALRSFRDQHLLNHSLGRIFVRAYYRLSPAAADFIAQRESLKRMVKNRLLDPLVRRIRSS